MPSSSHMPRCLITGSASGIGRALAQRLLATGWQVTGVDRAATGADDFGPGYTGHTCDLADTTARAALVRELASNDSYTAIVHGAGIVRTGGVADTDPDDAALLWRVHVDAPVALMNALASKLTDQSGRVVLISSRAVLGRPGRAAYAASKAAQIGLARSWATELIGRGVTVNVVAPGAVDTPMLSDPRRGAPARVRLPLGRLIRADEVAATIAFLLGPDAGAITGQTLYVCGGASLDTTPF